MSVQGGESLLALSEDCRLDDQFPRVFPIVRTRVLTSEVFILFVLSVPADRTDLVRL